MKVGDLLKCVSSAPLEGNGVAPPVNVGHDYTLQEIHTCSCGQEHYHIGLESNYNYVTCYNCKRELPNGDKKHWCHPSRFE